MLIGVVALAAVFLCLAGMVVMSLNGDNPKVASSGKALMACGVILGLISVVAYGAMLNA